MPRVDEFCYEGGIVDFVKFLNEGHEIPDGLKRPIYLTARASPTLRSTAPARSRWRCSGTPRTPRRS